MLANRARLLRIVLVLVLYGFLIYAGQVVSDWALARLNLEPRPGTQATLHNVVMVSIGLYIVLLALPFVPGVEIGLSLMVMLGSSICFLVYLATVVALVLAFLIGRLLPAAAVVTIFDWMRLTKASSVVAALALLSAEERLAFFMSHVPTRFLSFLLRHRYIALAVLLNLPGNAVFGGGGGIALVAGASRIFALPNFLLTVALAVSPVPLAYYLADGFQW